MSEDVLKEVLKFKQYLERYLERDNVDDKVKYVIKQLGKLPVTLDILEETGIGKSVNAYRKRDGKVGELAKTLVLRWKLVAAGVVDPTDGSMATEAAPAQSERANVTSEARVANGARDCESNVTSQEEVDVKSQQEKAVTSPEEKVVTSDKEQTVTSQVLTVTPPKNEPESVGSQGQSSSAKLKHDVTNSRRHKEKGSKDRKKRDDNVTSHRVDKGKNHRKEKPAKVKPAALAPNEFDMFREADIEIKYEKLRKQRLKKARVKQEPQEERKPKPFEINLTSSQQPVTSSQPAVTSSQPAVTAATVSMTSARPESPDTMIVIQPISSQPDSVTSQTPAETAPQIDYESIDIQIPDVPPPPAVPALTVDAKVEQPAGDLDLSVTSEGHCKLEPDDASALFDAFEDERETKVDDGKKSHSAPVDLSQGHREVKDRRRSSEGHGALSQEEREARRRAKKEEYKRACAESDERLREYARAEREKQRQRDRARAEKYKRACAESDERLREYARAEKEKQKRKQERRQRDARHRGHRVDDSLIRKEKKTNRHVTKSHDRSAGDVISVSADDGEPDVTSDDLVVVGETQPFRDDDVTMSDDVIVTATQPFRDADVPFCGETQPFTRDDDVTAGDDFMMADDGLIAETQPFPSGDSKLYAQTQPFRPDDDVTPDDDVIMDDSFTTVISGADPVLEDQRTQSEICDVSETVSLTQDVELNTKAEESSSLVRCAENPAERGANIAHIKVESDEVGSKRTLERKPVCNVTYTGAKSLQQHKPESSREKTHKNHENEATTIKMRHNHEKHGKRHHTKEKHRHGGDLLEQSHTNRLVGDNALLKDNVDLQNTSRDNKEQTSLGHQEKRPRDDHQEKPSRHDGNKHSHNREKRSRDHEKISAHHHKSDDNNHYERSRDKNHDKSHDKHHHEKSNDKHHHENHEKSRDINHKNSHDKHHDGNEKSREKHQDKSCEKHHEKSREKYHEKSREKHHEKSRDKHRDVEKSRDRDKKKARTEHRSRSRDVRKTSGDLAGRLDDFQRQFGLHDNAEEDFTARFRDDEADARLGRDDVTAQVERDGQPARKKAKIEMTSPANPAQLDVGPLLPEISPHYKPLARGRLNQDPWSDNKQPVEVDESLISQKKYNRTAVYAGRQKARYLTAVPRLYDACLRVLSDNIDALEYVGGVPYEVLRPVLERCTPTQLYTLEDCNPQFLEDTDELWLTHVKRDFRSSEPQEHESWRELYLRLHDEREDRLKNLTASLARKIQANQKPEKVTKLAYVETPAKAPRWARK